MPTILVILLLGFGVPALQLEGVPNSELLWGTVALILSDLGYVAEVYRAGIESVHPSQRAAARSLGLSSLQATRYVVLPQAIRRVIPPLLNDFIALQKETALVSLLGPIEVLAGGADRSQRQLQLHAVRCGGIAVRGHHAAADQADRLAAEEVGLKAEHGRELMSYLQIRDVHKKFSRGWPSCAA